jgi:ankyrin repeat protein
MRWPTVFGAVLVLAFAWPVYGDDSRPVVDDTTVRAAVARAVTRLDHTIGIWHQNRACFSCHHQGLPIALATMARVRGIAVDQALAKKNISVGLQGLKSIDRAVQAAQQIDPALDTGNMLVAAEAAGVPKGLVRAAYAAALARWQRTDGSWHTIDVRPPQSASQITATALAIKALRIYLPPQREAEARGRSARAKHWLLSAVPRDTEDRTYQLFGALWAGADRATLSGLTDKLLAEQRPDGGWAQFAARQPDAYATGEVLVALHDAGLQVHDPRYQRGLQFLLSTQWPDGSWLVPTRIHEQQIVSPPHFETGFPHGEHQMISAMGTAWAIRALLTSVRPSDVAPVPLVAPAEWQLAEEAPWMSVALFGSTAELQQLLDGGLDTNSRTADGTTLLMMTAGDKDKVALLIDRGADVNLAAKTGFTPLIVASNHPGNIDVIRLLVSRGAKVTPLDPKPLHDASPLFYAAWTGNIDAVNLFAERGADLRRKMLVAGIVALSPAEMAVFQGDAEMVRLLVQKGADVNEVDDTGISLLSATVLGNDTKMIRTLLALGAHVNEIDEHSLTPLMHAALIDYGDTEVVQLLLEAGADPSVKSKDGLTALDLARRAGHTAIARALEGGRPGH